MNKKELLEFLKWYCNSDYVESEIGGYWVNYKTPKVLLVASEIVDCFLLSREQNDKRSVARDGDSSNADDLINVFDKENYEYERGGE